MKQIKFYDIANNSIHGGIMLDDGWVVCGCCGGLFEEDEFKGEDKQYEIFEEYENWIPLEDTILRRVVK